MYRQFECTCKRMLHSFGYLLIPTVLAKFVTLFTIKLQKVHELSSAIHYAYYNKSR